MTGAGALKRILADPNLHGRWTNTKILPIDAREAMRVTCELIAYSDEPGVYRLQPELDGEETLEGRLARQAGAIGSEPEMRRGLELLARLGFLLMPDPLSIVVPACMPKRAKRGGPDKGGRPPKGMTAAQAKQHRIRQASEKAQGHLKLPITGNATPATATGQALATNLRQQFEVAPHGPETSTGNLAETVEVSPGKPETETWSNSPNNQVSVSASRLAESGESRTSSESKDSQDLSRLTDSVPAAREAEPGGVLDTETGRQVSASRLAVMASTRNQFSPTATSVAPRIMQGYLADGYSVAEIEAAIAQPRPCKSAAYYKPVLEELRARARTAEATALADPAAPAPRKLDPRIDDHPPWSKLSSEKQCQLRWMLELLDQPHTERSAAKLRELKGRHTQMWDLLVARYPDASQKTDWDYGPYVAPRAAASS